MRQTNRIIIRLKRLEASEEPSDSLFSATDMSRFYFPGRGVIGSVFLHALAIILIFFLPMFKMFLRPVPPPDKVVFIDLSSPRTVMYLPPLQGTRAEPEPKQTVTRSDRGEPAPSAGTEGLSFPGLQPMLSDTPEPTNSIQTILQPEVVDPPTLVPPLPVPNMVQTEKIPMVVQAPSEQTAEPEMVLPALDPIPMERIRTKDLTHLDSASSVEVPEPPTSFPPMEIPDLVRTDVEPEMVLPEPESAPIERFRRSDRATPSSQPEPEIQKPSGSFPSMEIPDLVRTDVEPEMALPEPESAPIERLERLRRFVPYSSPEGTLQTPDEVLSVNLSAKQIPDLVLVPSPASPASDAPGTPAQLPAEGEPFLTLTPLPALPVLELEIPVGEARGQFAISPEPNLSALEQKPGVKTKPGTEEDQPESKEISIGTGTDPGPDIIVLNGTGDSVSSVEYADTSEPAAQIITGTGNNAFEGVTILSGSDPANSDPSVAVLSPYEGSTEGITVIDHGQMPDNGQEFIPAGRLRRPLQTSYGLSLVSTENSGGGLPSYGVFQKDRIYTVYLDMRRTEFDKDPSWILEFSLVEDHEDNPFVSLDQTGSTEGLVLPFPAKKTCPVFPEDLVRRHQGGMIVVYGTVNTYGKIENLSIQDSPDNILSDVLLRSLHNWVFRPAFLNGETVAVKVLIGIPLWLPEHSLE